MKITAVIVAGGKGTRMGADKIRFFLKYLDVKCFIIQFRHLKKMIKLMIL